MHVWQRHVLTVGTQQVLCMHMHVTTAVCDKCVLWQLHEVDGLHSSPHCMHVNFNDCMFWLLF